MMLGVMNRRFHARSRNNIFAWVVSSAEAGIRKRVKPSLNVISEVLDTARSRGIIVGKGARRSNVR